MDLSQLLGELVTYKKNLDSVVKLLKETSRLEQNRMGNLTQLRARLTKLDKIIGQLGQGADRHEVLCNWVEQYKQGLINFEEQIKKRFGVELEQELKKKGLSLSGQYPDLKAGLLTIELDFDKRMVTLWYGPKQERLDKCRLLAVEVANRVEKVRQQLGSHLEEEEFLKKLEKAYFRAAGNQQGVPVPIIEVLSELAYLFQSPQFRQDPRRENYRGYSRADFSYDLFRVQRSEQRTLFAHKLHLTVATRAHTKRRHDFLWVPDDESGRGTTYSHLQFKEATS